MFHSPLHLVGFLLNPKWSHNKPWFNDEVSTRWQSYMGNVYPNKEDHTIIKEEMLKYIRGT